MAAADSSMGVVCHGMLRRVASVRYVPTMPARRRKRVDTRASSGHVAAVVRSARLELRYW